MNQLTADGIILTRVNYGEADRIVKLLTPDSGKLSLMARGVRKPKSKMAGGIELFSVSSLTYIKGRGDLGRLLSIRLDKHYGNIVRSIERVQLGYELIKMLDRATEDEPEPDYFEILVTAFESLDRHDIAVELVRFWFHGRLLAQAGHTPNLETDVSGKRLTSEQTYSFDFDSVSFAPNPAGKFSAHHIKFLRLAFAGHPPATLQQVTGSAALVETLAPLVQTVAAGHLRLT